MKKRINFNFITLSAAALVFLIFGICMIIFLQGSAHELAELRDDISSVRESAGPDGVNDVEGYGIIVNSMAWLTGSLGLALAEVFFVKIPTFCGITILVLSFVTRLLYRKNTAYRILSCISYTFTLIVTTALSYAFFSSSDTLVLKLLTVIFLLYVVLIAAAGFRNAFSKQIQSI